jgi:hypothetical protein
MTSPQDPAAVIGREVVDHQGGTLGRVDEVFRDATTGDPAWMALRHGRGRNVLLPYQGVWARGDHLVSRWDEDRVRHAPSRDRDAGRPGAEEEQHLYDYFGEGWSELRAAGRAPYRGLGEGPRPVVERRDVEGETG